MHNARVRILLSLLLTTAVFPAGLSLADEPSGPLLPHTGGQIATAFSNHFGPDAESSLTFTAINADGLSLKYVSTRGLVVQRTIRNADAQAARSYVMGYAAKMPPTIPNTTSLGISSACLQELRNNRRAAISLVYDADLNSIPGELTLVERDIKVPLIVEDHVMDVPAIHAKGQFAAGGKQGTGDFFILDNKNNPMMIQSTVRFSWEKQLRDERITRITAGDSMRAAMEQSLSTLRRYDLYGIHFDFDKATLRPDSTSLMSDIAQTLKHNPSWTLQVNGHTDSIGDPAYNQKLSGQRAGSVVAALVAQGIDAGRLHSAGLGETQPKGDNTSLEGRALNRRVELVRTDR
jgi:outer membrane protein OmpA-like peptidoglycan-associated protein